jgi:hypothetical protein
MTDPDLLSTAISVSRLGTNDFATDILDVNEERITRWLSGERRMPIVVRAVHRHRPTPRLDLRGSSQSAGQRMTARRIASVRQIHTSWPD